MSIKNALTRGVNKGILQVRKHAPEILLVTSLTSGAAALGLTVKQTLTVAPILEPWKDWMTEYKDGLEKKQYAEEHPEMELPPFPEETANQIMVATAIQVGTNLLKHYALPLAFAGLSAAATMGMYKVWKARYTAVVAVAAGLQETLKKYREEIREQLGEDADKETMAKVAVDKREESATVDPETKQKKYRPSQASQYARIFDESSTYYKRCAGDNLSFLQRQQAIANSLLKINGSVFLNEVYDMLGFPRTKAGSVVGWIFDPGIENKIDFGFWDLNDERKRAFINGWEKSVVLDFNVDGIIYDII